MRIGVMLRSLDEKGGIGVYTRYVLEALLELDERNEYVLLYRDPSNLGRYADRPNVRERVVRGRTKPWWDQVAVPWACWREGVDVVFHPKFTVPFLAPCPAVMTVHGADWFIPEHARFYGRLDVAYIRAVMPAYFRRAAAVLSVSGITTENFNRILGLEPGKVVTTYLAPGRQFRPVEDPERLEEVRERYQLPGKFLLTLSKVGGEGRKNLPGILASYERIHGRVPHRLVIGGQGCEAFRYRYGIPEDGWGADVVFPGWIDQADLPAVYSMADLYLYPSNLEAFPIPISEALACGTPVVTSRANGLEEIAGDAAILVDPEDPADIARGALEVLADPARRRALSEEGIRRAARFSWERCARETLAVLEGVRAGRRTAAAEPTRA